MNYNEIPTKMIANCTSIIHKYGILNHTDILISLQSLITKILNKVPLFMENLFVKKTHVAIHSFLII